MIQINEAKVIGNHQLTKKTLANNNCQPESLQEHVPAKQAAHD
jgi:hypothetical protein